MDGHVHLHECFDLDMFLTATAKNFASAAEHARLPGTTPGCLFLVETAAHTRFRDLRDRGLSTAGGWSIRPGGEALSVWARHDHEGRFALIAGRQIATGDGLEVLAIGLDSPVSDGLPIRLVLEIVSDHGAIPVIPWGFGKWWFRRGHLVEDLVRDRPVPTMFIGDNGGRARGRSMPRLFGIAASSGVWNLPGSDPLPLKWQVDRAATYGFHLACEPNREKPAAQVIGLLRSARAQPAIFGARLSLSRFARAQIGIRTP